MKLNGSSYKNTIFHSLLSKAFDVVQGRFYSEQLCPTLPFLILMLALISPSPSLELQGLTSCLKLRPERKSP